MSDWVYLTADQLIHETRPLGVGPVRDHGALDACMASPAQSFDGDLYPDISAKAAIVCFNIAKTYHPFVDGNKRAAAVAMLLTCYLNSFVPMLTEAELVAVILLVAQGEMTQEGLAAYLRLRMT
ncbi:MAG: Fic family protein [Actinophytocola sp.]|uniref:type II toxin-antitoxin system death-on-curing family toxin n=1 Tax=Actinophytocola sp. TaxID=1872138 RepID=UPI003C714888